MERGDRREGGETGGARRGPRARVEPRDQAVDIDGGGDRDVLQVGLRHAPVPGPAQAKGADPLGERPFDAGPPLIALLTLLARSPGLCRVQRLILVLGREPQPSPRVLGTGTAGPHRTRPTRMLVEFDNDGATTLPTAMLPPRHRQVALGAAHLVLVPGHRKLLERVRPLDLGLPALAWPYGTPQDDAVFVTAVDEYFRADIGGIHQVFTRRNVLVDQRLLDECGALRFMDRGRRRVHVREQVRGGGVTRFADVHHIPGPRRVAFVAVARLDIVGRFDALGGRWQVSARPETHIIVGAFSRGCRCPRRPLVVALPRPAQGLHAW